MGTQIVPRSPGIKGFGREEGGVAVPNTKSGTRVPRFPTPSSLRSLTLAYCAHTSPLRGGRCSPKSRRHSQLPTACPTPDAIPGLAGPHDPSSYLLPPGSFSCFLSAPQLLANLFPSHPHPTFTTSPTTNPLHRLPGGTVSRGGFFRKLTSL